jgi:hypothetical protein
MLAVRPQFDRPNWNCRPIGAGGRFFGFSTNDRSTHWNSTFAHAAEEVSDGDSGRSRVTSTDRGQLPAERLHPKEVY